MQHLRKLLAVLFPLLSLSSPIPDSGSDTDEGFSSTNTRPLSSLSSLPDGVELTDPLRHYIQSSTNLLKCFPLALSAPAPPLDSASRKDNNHTDGDKDDESKEDDNANNDASEDEGHSETSFNPTIPPTTDAILLAIKTFLYKTRIQHHSINTISFPTGAGIYSECGGLRLQVESHVTYDTWSVPLKDMEIGLGIIAEECGRKGMGGRISYEGGYGLVVSVGGAYEDEDGGGVCREDTWMDGYY